MQFEYQIAADEYVAAHLLRERIGNRGARLARGSFFLLSGLFMVFFAWDIRNLTWAAIGFLASSAWWIWLGVVTLYPSLYYRRMYRKTRVEGKNFKAEVNDVGFEVEGDLRRWQVQWPGAHPKGEDEIVFAFFSAGTVFVFGKKYLNAEQQRELRHLSGLKEFTC
jgi:hypothetical protein